LQLTLFSIENGETVSQAIQMAAAEYALRTGNDPDYAWVKQLPKGVEYGAEVKISKTVLVNLFSANWMPERAVAVGRGNS
jgi:hypothetical protein